MKQNISKQLGLTLSLGLWLTLSLSLSLSLTSCQDLADNDYFKDNDVRNTNVEVSTTTMTAAEYVQSNSEYSEMAALLQQQGVFEEMASGQLHTMLVVANDHFTAPSADEVDKTAHSHVSSLSVIPSKLKEMDRIPMLSSKNVNVTLDSVAQATGDLIDHVKFNNASLLKIINTADGYIYVVDQLIVIPTSLKDYIDALDETKYSIFKHMVTASGGQEFDKDNSKVVGVDAYGNTLYDSVFIYTNEFFDAKNFDLSSEKLSATMLIFSNEVINQALSDAMDKLTRWGYNHKTALLRNGSLDSVFVGYSSYEDLQNWILQAAFYRQKYTADQIKTLSESDAPDMTSIYDRKWRTSIQQLDLDNPVELSNGIAYEVKSFRIPNNRLIYRLHEPFEWYQQCSADQKAEYYKFTNIGTLAVGNKVAGWTPLSGVWPLHENNCLTGKLIDTSNPNFSLDFTPIHCWSNDEGGYDIAPMLIPAGEYKFRMGFAQNMNMNLQVKVGVYKDAESEPEWFFETESPIALASAGTAYHYDRGAMASSPRLPEYYDTSDSRLTAGTKNAYYWTDGGTITDKLVVPESETGEAQRIVIRLYATDGSSSTGTLTFNHWCLRPTDNNY